jgi:hypothetical protein
MVGGVSLRWGRRVSAGLKSGLAAVIRVALELVSGDRRGSCSSYVLDGLQVVATAVSPWEAGLS